ncbi:TonB-dependent receptor [Aquincola sp. S2]|uniref:TonB-dependent receptor n=1 Tax=Pseudaquabacterium terrae TaxID=2732868 RepID=A0ABX2ELX2_9BURK|nr:TonB-dependent receptor [Aquabacterium terrae]
MPLLRLLAAVLGAGVARVALAQTPAAPAPAASAASAPAARTQQVEVIGNTGADSNADRRRSTASRIVYGREEIDRMGDATLGEVLKRLPGVTLGGPPGRGGQIRMRGMGGGYTQILIDGQRMPFGFSLDSIAPEQIERIEIMRAPVAEHGARAIAGTINVIMREDFKRQANDVKLSGGFEHDRPQGGVNWIYSGQNDKLGYNLTATAFRNQQGSDSRGVTRRFDAAGQHVLEELGQQRSRDRRQGVFMTSRLQFRLAPGESLDLQPFLSLMNSRGSDDGTLQQTLASGQLPSGVDPLPYTRAHADSSGRNRMARLNGTWMKPTGSGGRLQLRFGSMLATNQSRSRRQEFDDADGRDHLREDDSAQRDLSIDLNGKYSQLLAERHSVSAGWELQRGERRDRRRTERDGVALFPEYGDNLEARTLRLAGYVQDEWDWSKTFSFYAGLRWEGIETRSDSALDQLRNRSSVLTPLLHMVWKLPDAPRDQIRLGLTRSYRAPNTSDLLARPQPTLRPNSETNPDRAGNPALKPELAWGLDLGLEHYLDAGGIVSANVFMRRIDNLIRRVTSLEPAGDPARQRFVSRPQNIGGALSAGLELEGKARASDLWATELPLSLRGNLSLLWSRVDGVRGPNNRLDQQPRFTANVGFDLPLRGSPLTVGGNLNYTPGFEIQQLDERAYRQGRKRVLDGYALWRFNPSASARLSVSNAAPLDFETGSTVLLDAGGWQTQDSVGRSYATVTLRAELRF